MKKSTIFLLIATVLFIMEVIALVYGLDSTAIFLGFASVYSSGVALGIATK